MGDLLTFLFVIVRRLTFFGVGGFALLLFLVSTFFFVRSFALLFLLVFTFFFVDGFAFIVVDGFANLFLFGYTFFGVVVATFASLKEVEEEGVGYGGSFGLGVTASCQAQYKEGL